MFFFKVFFDGVSFYSLFCCGLFCIVYTPPRPVYTTTKKKQLETKHQKKNPLKTTRIKTRETKHPENVLKTPR